MIDASLFLEDRNEESNDTVTFTRFLISNISEGRVGYLFSLSYKKTTFDLFVRVDLLERRLGIIPRGYFIRNRILEKNTFVSYELFQDSEMRLLKYTSPKIGVVRANGELSELQTPSGPFANKLVEAYRKKNAIKLVICVEIILPIQIFEKPNIEDCFFHFAEKPDLYPENFEDDFLLDFNTKSDITIVCPDGSFRGVRKELFLASSFFKRELKNFKGAEFIVANHTLDVVKPIIIYLHSLCFEMPKQYTLDYARRLFTAMEYFQPIHKHDLRTVIEQSLCEKFSNESQSFPDFLQWLSLVYFFNYNLCELRTMVYSSAANNFYNELQTAFPPHARNDDNLLFVQTFPPGQQHLPFRRIEEIYEESFDTKIVLS